MIKKNYIEFESITQKTNTVYLHNNSLTSWVFKDRLGYTRAANWVGSSRHETAWQQFWILKISGSLLMVSSSSSPLFSNLLSDLFSMFSKNRLLFISRNLICYRKYLFTFQVICSIAKIQQRITIWNCLSIETAIVLCNPCVAIF